MRLRGPWWPSHRPGGSPLPVGIRWDPASSPADSLCAWSGLLRSTAHPCLATPTPTPTLQASLTLASGVWPLEPPAPAQGNHLVKCPEFRRFSTGLVKGEVIETYNYINCIRKTKAVPSQNLSLPHYSALYWHCFCPRGSPICWVCAGEMRPRGLTSSGLGDVPPGAWLLRPETFMCRHWRRVFPNNPLVTFTSTPGPSSFGGRW